MPDRIIIRECVFGGRYIVTFEPRFTAWPSLEFRVREEALACAEKRAEAHGWRIVDMTAEGEGA